MDKCSKCGAVKARWMGGHHECMPAPPEYHPYIDFLKPLEFDE